MLARDPERLPPAAQLAGLSGWVLGCPEWAPALAPAAVASSMSAVAPAPAGPIHLLHIAKAGGTAVQDALAACADDGRMRFEVHETSLADLPPGARAAFVVRDPVERYVSGFNSRLRQGRPRHDNPWREGEEAAFARFATPNALAEALSDPDPDTAAAARAAIGAIYHTRAGLDFWLGTLESLTARAAQIAWVGYLPTLASDFERLKRLVGAPGAALPTDDLGAHRTPDSFEKRLSLLGSANIRRWYARDYEVFHAALALRARQMADAG